MSCKQYVVDAGVPLSDITSSLSIQYTTLTRMACSHASKESNFRNAFECRQSNDSRSKLLIPTDFVQQTQGLPSCLFIAMAVVVVAFKVAPVGVTGRSAAP